MSEQDDKVARYIAGEAVGEVKLPVSDPAFWRERLKRAKQLGHIHQSVYMEPDFVWERILDEHRKLLEHILIPKPFGIRLLDAGCGYGSTVPLLPEGVLVHYWGVDISPDLVAEAKEHYPEHNWDVGDMLNLPYCNNDFDICICRSVDGMIVKNLGQEVWDAMLRELLRVAPVVALMEYTEPSRLRLVRREA